MPLFHTDRSSRSSRTTKPQTITRWVPRPLEQLEDRTTPSVSISNTPTWLDAGPNNISGGEISSVPSSTTNSSVSGALQAIVADPTDPTGNTLYAGGVNGGIWKTTNALDPNPTWVSLTDSFPSLSISCISINPDDHLKIIAGIGGTADGSYAIDPNTGAHTVLDSRGLARGDLIGALYSEDGGAHWRVLSNNIAGQNIVGVAARTDYLLVAGDNGVFRSTDAGLTFTKITVGAGLPTGGVFDLAADPGAPVVQIASATWNNGIATITTAGPHALNPNQSVVISGLTPSGYNGTFIITVTGLNSFTYSLPTNPGNVGAGGTQDSPAVAITAATWAAGIPVGTGIATITTAAPSGLAVGESVTIAGVSQAGYNGNFVVTSVISPTQFTYALFPNPGVNPPGSAGLAFISPNAISAATWLAGTATITTTTPNTVQVGEQVTVAGVSLPGYNGTFTVTTVNNAANTISYALTLNPGNTTTGGTETNSADAIISATWLNGLATIRTNGPNGISVGQTVTINVPTRPGFNGTFVVRSIDILTDSFTYALAANPGGTGTNGTATAAAITINTATFVAGVSPNPGTVTITTSSAHGLIVGETVTIAGIRPSNYNGTFVVTSVISPTQFTYALFADPGETTTGGIETANSNPNSNPNTDLGARNRFYVAIRSTTGPIDPINGTPGGTGVYRSDDGGLTWGAITNTTMQIGAKTTNVQIAVFNSGIITNNIVYVAVMNNNPSGATNAGSESSTTGVDYAWRNRRSELSTITWSPNQGLTWTRMDAPRATTDPDDIAGVGLGAGNAVIITTSGRHQLRSGDQVLIAGVRDAFVAGASGAPPHFPTLIGGINGVRYVRFISETSFMLVDAFDNPVTYGGTLGGSNGTWAQILGANAGERPEFFDLVADPTRSTTVYLGTDRSQPDFYNLLNNGPRTYTSTLWRGNRLATPSGGSTASNQWVALNNRGISNGSSPGADVRDLFMLPTGQLLSATGGGLYVLPEAAAAVTNVEDATWDSITNTATIFTDAPHGLSIGDSVTLFGIASAMPIVGGAANGYNGIFVITAATAFSFSYTINTDPGHFISSDTEFGSIATTQFTDVHPFTAEQSVRLINVLPTGYNGTYVITSTPQGTEVSAPDTIVSATWLAGTATIATSPFFPHGMYVGQTILITGCDVAGYNGQFVVLSVTANSFTYALPTDPGTTVGTVGTVTPTLSNTIVRAYWADNPVPANRIATIETALPNGYVVGETVKVQSTNSGYNGTFVITAVHNATTFSYALPGNPGTFSAGGIVSLPTVPHNITGATWTAGVITFTNSGGNNRLRVGDTVTITGIDPEGYNGTYTVKTVNGAGTQFTVDSPLLITPGTYGGGGVENVAENPIIDVTASGSSVTMTTAGPNNLSVGELVVIKGISGYTGTFVVSAKPAANQFRFFANAGSPDPRPTSLTYTLNNQLADSTANGRAYPTNLKWATSNGNLSIADVNSVAYDALNNIIFAGTIDTQGIAQNATGGFDYSGFFGAAALANDFHDQANVFKVLVDNTGLDNTGTPTNSTIRYYVGSNFRNIFRQSVDQFGVASPPTSIIFSGNLTQGIDYTGLTRDDPLNLTNANQNVHIAMALNTNDQRRAIFGYNGLYEDADPSGPDETGTIVVDITPQGMGGHVEFLLYGGKEGGQALNQIVYMTTSTGELWVRGRVNETPTQAFGSRTANLVRDFGGPISSIYSVVADPDDYKHFFVAVGNAAGVNKIMETRDFGATFTDITANLIGPATADGTAGLSKLTTEIRTLVVFDSKPGISAGDDLTLIAGGRGGVYRLSANPDCIDAPWTEYGRALPNTVVNDLQIYPAVGVTQTVNSATWTPAAGSTPAFVTITTAAPSGAIVGQSITIAGINPNGYNGTFTVTSTPTANSFTYELAANPGAFVAGTGSATPINQRLLAGTAGRGIWQIVDIIGTVAQDSVLTVTGSAAADVISISLNPDNPNEIQVYDSSAPPASRITNYQRGTFTKLVINGGAGADKIIIASKVDPVTRLPLAGSDTNFVNFDVVVDGGGDINDQLIIDSRGSTAAIQATITSTTIGNGTGDNLFVGCGEVAYKGFDAGSIDITTGSGSDSFILSSLMPGTTTLRGGDGSENYAVTFDTSLAAAYTLNIVDSGIVGTDTFVATGTAGADTFDISATSIAVAAQTVNYSGIENFSVFGLAGNDNFNITGYGGLVTDNFDGGNGSDTYASIPMVSTNPAVINVTDTGTGLTDVDSLQILGTLGNDTFAISTTQVLLGAVLPNIQTLNYSGLEGLGVDGLAGSDTYNVAMDPAGTTILGVADTGLGGTDVLNVAGTANADNFTVTATQITLAPVPATVPPTFQTLNYSGLENTAYTGLGGADVFNVTGVGGTLGNLFNGGLLGDTYNITMNPASTAPISVLDSGAAGTTDILNVFGTAGNDVFNVTPTLISLGTQLLTYSAAIESLILNGLAGNDSVTLATQAASANVAFSFIGGIGLDTLSVIGVAGNEDVAVDITSGLGIGSFSGLRQSVAFTGTENLAFDGSTGTNSFHWHDRTGSTYGTANTPEAGVIYTPTGAASGKVRVGSGSAFPNVAFANVNGTYSMSGDADASNRDTLTILGVSTNGLQSTYGELTSADGSDTVVITDQNVTISNAALGSLRSVSFDTYGTTGIPSFGTIEVRGGNEAVIGDRFNATPSLKTNLLIDGMNPTTGSAADLLTVVSTGSTSRYQPTGTVLGPPQTRIVQTSDGASVGYFHIENAGVYDTTQPGGGGGGGGGAFTPSNGYYAAASDVGAPAEVQVYDRLTGGLIFDLHPFVGFNGGVRVAIGDVNGDGTPDIVVAAGPGAAPHVKVFDGTSGRELASFYAYDQGFLGGVELAVGDLNGDGYAEIITGDGPGVGAGPHIKVFDGLTFAEKASFYAFDPTYYGGIRVAVGDTNGDGTLDLIVSAQGGANSQPRVSVFDGRNPTVMIMNFFAYAPTFEGGVFVAAGDVNGDGFADVIVGAGGGGTPDVRAFSGRDGLASSPTVLTQFFANDEADTSVGSVPIEGGVRVASVDIDNDGIDDILTARGAGTFPYLRFYRIVGGPVLVRKQPVFSSSYAQGVFVGG